MKENTIIKKNNKNKSPWVVLFANGCLVNFYWYFMITLVCLLLLQRSSGRKAWIRGSIFGLLIAIIHSSILTYVFTLTNCVGFTLSCYIVIALHFTDVCVCLFLLFFITFIKIRRRWKSLKPYIYYLTAVHALWMAGDLAGIVSFCLSFVSLRVCVYLYVLCCVCHMCSLYFVNCGRFIYFFF